MATLTSALYLTLSLLPSVIVAQTTKQTATDTLYLDGAGRLVSKTKINEYFEKLKARQTNPKLVALKKLNKVIRRDSVLYEVSYVTVPKQSKEDELRQLKHRNKIVGAPLPDFALEDLTGRVIRRDSLLGKPMMISLWFTTCPPCIKEIPELNRMKAMPEYAHVNFVAITFEKKEKVKEFLKKTPFEFIHLANARKYCEYFTEGYPLNIFVNKDGIVAALANGIPTISRDNGKTVEMDRNYLLNYLKWIK